MVEENHKSSRASMDIKHRLHDTNLEAQSDMWVTGVVQAQPSNMLSLADS